MKKLTTLVTAVSLLFAGSVLADNHEKAERPPNIVLLIGDDHGAPYFGFMGDDNVVTPNMDMIAEAGVTFTQGHATANHCRPSLRTLITGLHPVQYKMIENEIMEERRKADKSYADLDKDERRMWEEVEKAAVMKEFDTLPKMLRTEGYVSWQGGKWWENSFKNGHFDEGMTKGWNMDLFGQDEFFFEMMGSEGMELGRGEMEPVFDFISRNKERPFFVWYGPALPHTPFDADYEQRKYYEHRDLTNSAKMYYANITRWDQGVGQLLDHVYREGILENTLFIYINDNGWEQDPDVEYAFPDSDWYTDVDFANGGDKGKLGLYDQSFRTPVIFYWKDRLQGSMDTSSLVSMEDIVPTILDIAGVSPMAKPDNLPGVSLKPVLEGQQEVPRNVLVGYAHQRRFAKDMMGQRAEGYYVRTKRWHFMWYKDTDEMALYDVTVDPKAKNNLIEKFPQLIPGFKAHIEDWKKNIGMVEPIPVS